MNGKMDQSKKKIKSAHDFFPFCLMFGRLSASLCYFSRTPFCDKHILAPLFLRACVHGYEYEYEYHSRKDISTHSGRAENMRVAVRVDFGAAAHMSLHAVVYGCGEWRWAPNVCFSLVAHCSWPFFCAIDRIAIACVANGGEGNGNSKCRIFNERKI